MTNPLVCHGKDNFLKCYNDGDYILKFGDGNLKEFMTTDLSIKYSEIERTIVFIQKGRDSIQIKQLPKSILISKGAAFLEITSLSNIPNKIYDYDIVPYSIDNFVRGLSFIIDNKHVEIEISTFWKKWSWNIVIRESDLTFAVLYNGFKKNRLEHIFIRNDSLKYGMAAGMTFKSLKKLSRLESLYVDTITISGTTGIGNIPLEKNYRYQYSKMGKLKSQSIIGELKLCACD